MKFNFKELASVVATLGHKSKPEDVDDMIKQLDEDGSGTVDFPEFLIMMAKTMNQDDKKEDLKQAFDLFDENNDGFIRCFFLHLKYSTSNLCFSLFLKYIYFKSDVNCVNL